MNKPQSVKTAEKWLYFLLVGINAFFFAAASLLEAASQFSNVIFNYSFINVINIGMNFFLVYMIGKGRNWARITLIAWHVIFIPLYIILFVQYDWFMLVDYGYLVNPFLGNMCIVGFIISMAVGIPGIVVMIAVAVAIIRKIFLILASLFFNPSPEWFR